MTDPRQKTDRPNSTRILFWTSALFYVLIAFEFFYMASPFAAYFYSVYGPGLDGLQQFGFSGWTLWFFLPHLVEETRSTLINLAEGLGIVLFFGGILGFTVGAFQVYRAKLTKSEAVTGGLYRYIRHPQYLALIIASFGMLLIWPRFLVLFSTCLVVLAYTLLAKTEERICLNKYDRYADYLSRTGRFLPKSWFPFEIPTFRNKIVNWIFGISAWTGIVLIATIAAFGLRELAIGSLYTHQTKAGVYLSITEIDDASLSSVAKIVVQAPEAAAALQMLSIDGKLLAYVLPTNMYVSEIPMHLPEGKRFGHTVPRDRNRDLYKVIFTRAEFSAAGLPEGESIIAHAVNKHPLIEVHVNLQSEKVEAVFPPPKIAFYPDVQVPLF